MKTQYFNVIEREIHKASNRKSLSIVKKELERYKKSILESFETKNSIKKIVFREYKKLKKLIDKKEKEI